MRALTNNPSQNTVMSFGEHLEIMRKMLFRIILLCITFSAIIFYFKTETFDIILAPKKSDFITFNYISCIFNKVGYNFKLEDYNITLINTDLANQFMTHLSTSFMLGALLTSPYIVIELLRFIVPALYQNEKKYSIAFASTVYILFIVGILMSYYILFPISFRFLATYQVHSEIINTITLESYISTFTNLTFLMGITFELPIIIFILGKMKLIDRKLLKQNRPYTLIVIMIISAIITPPDLFTLILVTLPLYTLYELSILTLPKSTQDIHKLHEHNIESIEELS